MKQESYEYKSCSINIASTNKKNNKKRDGHNTFLECKKPGPSMTSHLGEMLISLYD